MGSCSLVERALRAWAVLFLLMDQETSTFRRNSQQIACAFPTLLKANARTLAVFTTPLATLVSAARQAVSFAVEPVAAVGLEELVAAVQLRLQGNVPWALGLGT
jgi:hypothetical protein